MLDAKATADAVVIGTRQKADAISFPVEGIDGGSISMLAVSVGQAAQDVRAAV